MMNKPTKTPPFILPSSFTIIVAWLSLYLPACVTGPQVSSLGEIIDDRDSTTLLLNYELSYQNEIKENNPCSVLFKHLDSGIIYSIPLHSDKTVVQVEAPYGHYQVTELACTKSKSWSLDHWGINGITVFPGKVNYLGRFVFQLSKNKDVHELEIFKGDREQTRKSLIQTARSHSSEWLNRVVSAYNGKLLSKNYLTDERNYLRGSVSHIVGKKVHLNSMDFDTCEKSEFKINPTPLGILSYNAEYQGNRLIKLERSADLNTFTDSYINCIENSLREFHPAYAGKVKYNVNF